MAHPDPVEARIGADTGAGLSLRVRFMAAMLLVVAVLSAAFFAAVWQVIELMEGELIGGTLARELQEFSRQYAQTPGLVPPNAVDRRGYIVRAGQDDTELPVALRGLPPGLYDDVYIDGREHHVGRRDVEGARLYLSLDVAPVGELETRVIALALVGSALGLGLALLTAGILARVVTAPVTRLARRVAELEPGRRGMRLQDGIRDPEVGRIAAALDRYLDRAEAFLQREQAFTEDASHELRTPLATIMSAAHLLLEQPSLPPQARERVTRVARAAARMQSLIEALLFLSREDGGLPAQACAMDEIVREAEELAREQAAQRGVALSVRAEPVLLDAPPGMAACVVNNLVLNAVQFTEPGGRVDVCLEPGRLCVRDTGIGIAAADIPQIFERRYRGPHSRGFGLGLHLVRRVCDRLGWAVRASGAPGAGACFEIRFRGAATPNEKQTPI